MARSSRRRNPLLPWWIGLATIIPVIVYVGYLFVKVDSACEPANTGWSAFIVLGLLPIVYLSLMYLTLKDQADREKE